MGQPPDRAAVLIAVGDEVLGGYIQDSNSHWLAQTMRDAGWPVLRMEVVGDAEAPIVEAVERAVADPRAARVLVSGGLGPTPDDLTLPAVARALGLPLEVNPEALAHVEGIIERMHQAGWVATGEVSEANGKMTLAPRGATILANRRGMASGIVCRLEGEDRHLIILPGVPRELKAIVTEEAIPRYFAGGVARSVVELRYRYAIEAQFVEPMLSIGAAFPDVSIGSYPQSETRELIIRITGGDPEQVAAAGARMREMRPVPEQP